MEGFIMNPLILYDLFPPFEAWLEGRFFFTKGHAGSCMYIYIYSIHRQKNRPIDSHRITLPQKDNKGIYSYGHVLFSGIKIKQKLAFGEMAEWLIAPVLKTGIVRNKELSRVRIPLSPFGRRMDYFIGFGWFFSGSTKWWYSRARKKKIRYQI